MSIAIGVFLLAAMIVSFASTAIACYALWRGGRYAIARIPPERRRRALVATVLGFLFGVPLAVVSIAAPWGPRTIAYVMLGCVHIPVGLIGAAAQARRDIRSARTRRHAPKDGVS